MLHSIGLILAIIWDTLSRVKYVPSVVAATPHPKMACAPGKYKTVRVLYMGFTRPECLSSRYWVKEMRGAYNKKHADALERTFHALDDPPPTG